MSTIRFLSLPRTLPPPAFIADVVHVFQGAEAQIGTEVAKGRMPSNQVLAVLRPGLVQLGFSVEAGKLRSQRIQRPVFFGENGTPTLRYDVDAYHTGWRCGLEVEAIRALRGGAVYRDLIQAMVMVDVDHMIIAVPNYLPVTERPDRTFADTTKVVDALYGHARVRLPYGLTVVGY